METPIWINGKVIPLAQASVGVEDRGYQFADGVYEVIRIYNGRLFTLRPHLERLSKSAEGLRLRMPMPVEQLAEHVAGFLPVAKLTDGFVYLQLTRGVAERNHRFPNNAGHTLLFYARPLPPAKAPGEADGLMLMAMPDERWKRCWIKSIGLIANVLAKNDALDEGYDEAVFLDGETITECATSNLFAVRGQKLITHPVGAKVLPGITRMVTLEVAAKLGVRVEERPLREVEVLSADEVFITSTTRELHWVKRCNERIIGNGNCGPMTLKLHRAFQDRVRCETSREAAA